MEGPGFEGFVANACLASYHTPCERDSLDSGGGVVKHITKQAQEREREIERERQRERERKREKESERERCQALNITLYFYLNNRISPS
jgi:hypothetical protein